MNHWHITIKIFISSETDLAGNYVCLFLCWQFMFSLQLLLFLSLLLKLWSWKSAQPCVLDMWQKYQWTVISLAYLIPSARCLSWWVGTLKWVRVLLLEGQTFVPSKKKVIKSQRCKRPEADMQPHISYICFMLSLIKRLSVFKLFSEQSWVFY